MILFQMASTKATTITFAADSYARLFLSRLFFSREKRMRTLKINNRHLLCVKIGRKGMGGRGERDLEPLFYLR